MDLVQEGTSLFHVTREAVISIHYDGSPVGCLQWYSNLTLHSRFVTFECQIFRNTGENWDPARSASLRNGTSIIGKEPVSWNHSGPEKKD